MSKKYLIILGGGLIITIVMIVLIVFSVSKKSPTQEPPIKPAPTTGSSLFSPTPSTSGLLPNTDEVYIENFQKNISTEADYHQKQEKIAELIKTLPYFGTYFTLSHSIEDGIFHVYFDSNKPQLAQEEFDNFLKNKGVDKNLMTIQVGFR